MPPGYATRCICCWKFGKFLILAKKIQKSQQATSQNKFKHLQLNPPFNAVTLSSPSYRIQEMIAKENLTTWTRFRLQFALASCLLSFSFYVPYSGIITSFVPSHLIFYSKILIYKRFSMYSASVLHLSQAYKG